MNRHFPAQPINDCLMQSNEALGVKESFEESGEPLPPRHFQRFKQMCK
jgi:hypothetical protein